MEGNPFGEWRFNSARKRGEWARSTSPPASLMEKPRFFLGGGGGLKAFPPLFLRKFSQQQPKQRLAQQLGNYKAEETLVSVSMERLHWGGERKGEAKGPRAGLGDVVVSKEGSSSIGQQPLVGSDYNSHRSLRSGWRGGGRNDTVDSSRADRSALDPWRSSGWARRSLLLLLPWAGRI